VTNKELYLVVRRAFFMVVGALDKRFGVTKSDI